MSASQSEQPHRGSMRSGAADVTLPADAALLPAAEVAVAGVASRLGLRSDVVEALRRAAEALASSLIQHAMPSARLDIAVAHDEEDVYLRMTVDHADSASLRSPGVTRLLLSGTIDSVDVGAEDDRVYGVVQLALR